MGTLLINSIQHRNGPNQRPPNFIFGTSSRNVPQPGSNTGPSRSAGGYDQSLISKPMICGILGALTCGVALITYLEVSLKHVGPFKGPTYEMGTFAVLSIAVFIIIVFVALMFIICRRRKKKLVVLCIEPSCRGIVPVPNEMVLNVLRNVPNTPSEVIVENPPPPYDRAIFMPSSKEKDTTSLPPAYENIVMI